MSYQFTAVTFANWSDTDAMRHWVFSICSEDEFKFFTEGVRQSSKYTHDDVYKVHWEFLREDDAVMFKLRFANGL